MKRFLVFIVSLLCITTAFSQVEMSKLTTKWVDLGNEEIEVFCYNGQPYTGKVFAKHSNGKIGLVGEFSKGIKNGTWTYWYSTGEKKRESSYVEGKKEGTTYYWHQNGQMAKEITYRNDKNIDQKLWDANGNRLKNPTFESFK